MEFGEITHDKKTREKQYKYKLGSHNKYTLLVHSHISNQFFLLVPTIQEKFANDRKNKIETKKKTDKDKEKKIGLKI